MDKYEIVKRIENFASLELAEDWDCSGWLVETKNTDIQKVLFALTVTEDALRQAKSKNCDMIISHHPMFCVNLDSELVSKKYKPVLDIYSAHTNMDKAQGGTTDTLIKVLGLVEYKKSIEHDFLRMIEFKSPISVEDFANLLKQVSPKLRYVNNKNVKKISKVMFCAGSGADFIEDTEIAGGECLVTGDLKFHSALDSDIVVFDIGHFESEILILPVFKTIIGENVEIVFAQEKSPFVYIS